MSANESDIPALRIFCAPISGGALVSQLALMKEISMARSLFDSQPDNIRPHIFLGNSGGNVCAYVGMAAQWSPYGIDRIASYLDPEMLTMSWWPKHLDFLPTSLIGIFTGSFYRQGYGVEKLYKNIFDRKMITGTEIWSGVFNKTKGKAQFFCNKREGETFINRERFESDRVLFNCENLTFTDGNVELLAKISVASASIPVIVSEQLIYGSNYVDGGVMYASPLSIMSGEIFRIVTGDYTAFNSIPEVIVVEDEIKVKCKGNTPQKKNYTHICGKGDNSPSNINSKTDALQKGEYKGDNLPSNINSKTDTLQEEEYKGDNLPSNISKTDTLQEEKYVNKGDNSPCTTGDNSPCTTGDNSPCTTSVYNECHTPYTVYDAYSLYSPCRDREEKSIVEILNKPSIKKYKLQLTYFSCYDMDNMVVNTDVSKSILGEADITIATMVNSLSITDRARGVELLRSISGSDTAIKHKHYSNLNTRKLSFILKEALTYSHYVLNLYPHGHPIINMVDFTTKDILDTMCKVQNAYGGHLWYIQ